jgi:hypothetical protein
MAPLPKGMSNLAFFSDRIEPSCESDKGCDEVAFAYGKRCKWQICANGLGPDARRGEEEECQRLTS